MYRVYQLTRQGYPTIRTIAAPQAGGCTRSELDRECERKARRKASDLFGGSPLDWQCLSFLGAYTSYDAAKTIAKYPPPLTKEIEQ